MLLSKKAVALCSGSAALPGKIAAHPNMRLITVSETKQPDFGVLILAMCRTAKTKTSGVMIHPRANLSLG